MGDAVKAMARWAVLRGYDWARQNHTIRSILYSEHNANLFSDFCQHEWMLACPVRVNTYHEAIRKHVRPDDVVVELGTGTGVLSMFASKNRPRRIYALDHGAIIDLARHVADCNGIDNIEFVNCHSSEFSLEGKADVIIQEQIGDFLFDEDMVSNVCDLRDRILAPGGKILPNGFELFIEPVMLAPNIRYPFLWEQKLHGIDFSCVREWIESERNTLGPVNPVTHGTRCQVSHFLCEIDPVFDFDLLTIQPNQIPDRIQAEKVVTRGGMLDGFCIYFRIIFDEEISFRTGPMDPPTTWVYQVYRTEPVLCEVGDRIHIDLSMPSQTDTRRWVIDHEIQHVKGDVKGESRTSTID